MSGFAGADGIDLGNTQRTIRRMPSLVLAPVALAVILIVGGAAKFGRPADAASAFRSLRVPGWLDQRVFHRALPVVEFVLAVGLLVLGPPGSVVVAVLVLALMVAYTVVVGRALTFGYPVDCGCFGRLGMGEISVLTLVRNVGLTILAVAALVHALSGGGSVVEVIAADPVALGWIVAALLVAAVAVLTFGRLDGVRAAPRPVQPADEVVADLDEADESGDGDLDYIRHPTPPAAVRLPDGSVRSVRELARQQAQLLVFVSPYCGSCEPVLERLDEYRKRLSPVALREVFVMQPERARELVDEGMLTSIDHALFDPDRMLGTALEVGGTPSAVLFGTDDLLAGGPVTGGVRVLEFLEDVAVQVEGA